LGGTRKKGGRPRKKKKKKRMKKQRTVTENLVHLEYPTPREKGIEERRATQG